MSAECFCGCCGRKSITAEELWCSDCIPHCLPNVSVGIFEDGRTHWDRTHLARHGRPCPFSNHGVFATRQPKDGDVILICEHDGARTYHWWAFEPEETVKRNDGAVFKAQWMVLCEGCFAKHPANPKEALRRDFCWVGNDPAVKKFLQ